MLLIDSTCGTMIMCFVFYRILFFLELKITSLLSVVSYLPSNNSSSNSLKTHFTFSQHGHTYQLNWYLILQCCFQKTNDILMPESLYMTHFSVQKLVGCFLYYDVWNFMIIYLVMSYFVLILLNTRCPFQSENSLYRSKHFFILFWKFPLLLLSSTGHKSFCLFSSFDLVLFLLL